MTYFACEAERKESVEFLIWAKDKEEAKRIADELYEEILDNAYGIPDDDVWVRMVPETLVHTINEEVFFENETQDGGDWLGIDEIQTKLMENPRPVVLKGQEPLF